MKRMGRTFKACMALLLSLALCVSNVMLAVAQDETTTQEETAAQDETAAQEESGQPAVEGDAKITLTAVYNKVYIHIAPTTDNGWTTFTLTATWDENVALKSAMMTTEFAIAISSGIGIQINTGKDSVGEFVASGAFTTASGKGSKFDGTAYVLEFDTEEEMTVTCGDASVVVNEKPENGGDAAITLTAENNKVYVNIAPAADDAWTNFTLTVMWDRNVALKSAETVSDFAIALGNGGSGVQLQTGTEYEGAFMASGAFTTADGQGSSYSGAAYVLEFDTEEEMTVTCGDASVAINQVKYDVKETDTGAVIEKYTGSNTNVELPEEIEGEKLEVIGANAFSNTPVETVVIPETVTKIEETAFADCSNLESVTIPSSVTEIGEDAFVGCENVTIRCYLNSVAYQYARKNSMAVSLLDIFTYGDATGDEKVEVGDALATLKDVVKLETLPDLQRIAADVDGKEGIDVSDALCILKKVVKLIETFPVQEGQE